MCKVRVKGYFTMQPGGDAANLAAFQALPKPRFTLPLLEWINIPAGKVTLETGWDNSGEYDYTKNYSQKPLGNFAVTPFDLSKYPMTNAQFQAFIDPVDPILDFGFRVVCSALVA